MSTDPQLQAAAQEICAHRGLVLGPEVGEGAFKHTFHVHTSAGDPRALKVYRHHGANARTQREVDAITRCTHPGVVRFELIDAWKYGGKDYVYSLEEYLAGGTLTARMAKAQLSVNEVRELAISLVDAVGHIAGLDLVHRDLKPDNIMFGSPGGPPVIVDFGLVRDLKQSSLTKTWLPHGPGTPFFAPAEQLNNEKPLIDWRADQFALGVLLTVAGTSTHPYALPGQDSYQVIDRVASRERPSPDFVAWATSNGLDALVRMVAPWPIERFRTPTLLAAAWAPRGSI
jgi:serine/threonine protein kinase